ncbi:MAG: flavodoxin domain-containing protein [Methanobacteriaceae archaeon]
MKIGIIIYSQTNHTYTVAQRLQSKLSSEGHEVDLERVVPVGKVNPGEINVNFDTQPATEPYDGLIFGSPVHGFNLAPAMNAYLNQIPSLQDKKIACFVTKGLPFDSTGGNQTIKQMKKICRAKGGAVIGTAIVTWSMSREKKINNLLERFSALF